jgi:hypothetical protein
MQAGEKDVSLDLLFQKVNKSSNRCREPARHPFSGGRADSSIHPLIVVPVDGCAQRFSHRSTHERSELPADRWIPRGQSEPLGSQAGRKA